MDKQLQPGRPVEPLSPEGLFRAFGDRTRLRILQLLLLEELSVSELVKVLGLPQSTVSRQLKVLADADLILDRRDGTTVFYHARPHNAQSAAPSSILVEWLRERPMPAKLTDRLQRVLLRRKDRTVDFFDRLGKRWDELRSNAFGDAFAGEALIGLLPGDWRVVDIGTGTGFLLPMLAGHFQEVIAVEPSQEMLRCARQRVSQGGHNNVSFHQGDLGRLPLPDASCELAIACLVMHHVPQPTDAMREILRILRTGGRILVVEQESHESQAFYETMQDLWWGFDPADFVKQMQAAGFEAVSQRKLSPVGSADGRIEAPGLFAVTARRGETTIENP